MPEYEYDALEESGVVTRGVASAESERALEDLLRERGRYLIRAEPRSGEDAARGREGTDAKVGRRELLSFTEHLSAATSTGLPILGTLRDIEGHVESKRFRRIIAEVRESIGERGTSLSEALAEHPRAFPPLYLGTIRAGEASGKLAYALQQLVHHLDWQQEISRKLRDATIYPAFIFTAVLLLVFLLVGFVYPRLLPILTSFDVELPLPTRILMGTSLFLQEYWLLLLAGLVASGAAVWLLRRSGWGRLALDRLVLRLPVFGPIVRQLNVTRFVTYLALMYRTGVDLLHGLQIVERMLPNRALANAVGRAREDVVRGENLSRAFARTGEFPSLVIRSLALGESTGTLDEALERIQEHYDREVPSLVRRLLAGLQPVLVVLLGVVIAVIGLSIFMPILSIYQSIGS